MLRTEYAIAVGSNRMHGTYGTPPRVIRAASEALAALGSVLHLSSIHTTTALGPAGRGFANAAIILSTEFDPPGLLRELKSIERDFGRRGGKKWGPRILDLDIILWSGGSWMGDGLIVPHPEMRRRRFVLDPVAEIAPAWRDPITGLTVRQLRARLIAPRPVDRNGSTPR